MSVKDVIAFYEKVEVDKALQENLKALDMKAKKAADIAVEELIKIAKDEGFEFTSQELFEARNKHSKTQSQVTEANQNRGCILIGLWGYDPPEPPCAHAAYAPPPPPPEPKCNPDVGLYVF
jgi:predicted ribosomally synthesized peptide with nif11-like leader